MIFSDSTTICILVKFTFPDDLNIDKSYKEKLIRYSYANLKNAAMHRSNGWTIHIHAIEVGALGCVSSSLDKFMKSVLGVSGSKLKKIKDRCGATAYNSSYIIWLHCHSKFFSSRIDILTFEGWKGRNQFVGHVIFLGYVNTGFFDLCIILFMHNDICLVWHGLKCEYSVF